MTSPPGGDPTTIAQEQLVQTSPLLPIKRKRDVRVSRQAFIHSLALSLRPRPFVLVLCSCLWRLWCARVEAGLVAVDVGVGVGFGVGGGAAAPLFRVRPRAERMRGRIDE